MINAIGLENPGIDAWIEPAAASGRALRQPVIVSVGGNAPEQYAAVVAALEAHLAAAPAAAAPRIEGYELNVSCPNVASGLQIGADPAATAAVVARLPRGHDGRFLLAKLTPNVTRRHRGRRAPPSRPAPTASRWSTPSRRWCSTAQTLRPFLGNRTGGLCGPAIKPIALRMVAEVAQALPGVPDRRHGRRDDRAGRARVHRLRRHGRGGGRRQLHRLRGAAAHPRRAARRARGARLRVASPRRAALALRA